MHSESAMIWPYDKAANQNPLHSHGVGDPVLSPGLTNTVIYHVLFHPDSTSILF